MTRERKSSFVRNAVILSAAGLISRLIGAVYRIPLYRLIDNEGIGLYQMGYQIYVVLLALSATGIPVAISKLVSEEASKNRYAEAQRVFRTAAVLLTSIGFISTTVLILSARYIASEIIQEPRAIYPLMAVAPAIFIVALMASFRGYFQGLQQMAPTAFSQIIEQLGRVIVVLVLALMLVNSGASVEHTAAAASFGTVAGTIMGLLAILGVYFWQRKRIKVLVNKYPRLSNRTTMQLVKRILAFAIPITLGAMVIPLMSGIDTVLVPRRLQVAGFTQEQATGMYGDLTGAAIPLINIPAMLAYALAASLVPAISEADARGRTKVVQMRSSFAIKLILLLGIPAAVGLHVLAIPIATMLFNAPSAGVPLGILAFTAIFLTLHQTCSGILQGLGHTFIPVRNLLIGGVIKVVLNFTLTAIPQFNIRGAAFASVMAYVVSSTLNVLAVRKYTDFKIRFSDMVFKPLIAVGIMALIVTLTYSGVTNSIEAGGLFAVLAFVATNTVATLMAVGFGGAAYGVALLLLRTFSKRELGLIPVLGPVLTPIAEKLRLLRRE